MLANRFGGCLEGALIVRKMSQRAYDFSCLWAFVVNFRN